MQVGDLEGVEEEEMDNDKVAVSMAVVSHCGVKPIAIDALMMHQSIGGEETGAER